MLTIYDHLEAAATVRQREKEKAALQYQRERQERRTLLDEHAEYLRTLTAIDALLNNIDSYLHPDERTILLNQIRAAMPPSIVATRKENVSRET